MPTLSLCLIARNEEKLLSRCLETVDGLADEIVLVDTGSTDRTMDIARTFGARIIEFTWVDHFSEARNRGLEEARGDWILVLDADEYLAPESQDVLRKTIRETPAAGINVLIRNILSGDALFDFQCNRFVRLFRRDPAIRFDGRIHEQVLPSLRRAGKTILDCDSLVIFHDGYAQTGHRRQERQERNLRLLQLDAKERPLDPFIRYHLGVTLQSLGRIPEAIESLRQAVQNEPSAHQPPLGPDLRTKAHTRLAQLYLAQNRLEEALHQCEQAVQQGGADPLAVFLTAVIHMHTYNFATAAKVLEWGLDASRKNASGTIHAGMRKDHMHLALAHCKRLDGRPKEALLDYRSCLRQNPRNLDAWIGLGECGIQVHNYPMARQAFQNALALAPDSETARHGLELCDQSLHRPVTQSLSPSPH